MLSLFKNLTREQRFNGRIEDVFTELTKAVEIEFTELETVQILNAVRRITHEWLEAKKNHAMEQAVNFNQKANEIKNAIEILE